jgi:hypothetical protein
MKAAPVWRHSRVIGSSPSRRHADRARSTTAEASKRPLRRHPEDKPLAAAARQQAMGREVPAQVARERHPPPA